MGQNVARCAKKSELYKFIYTKLFTNTKKRKFFKL